MKIAILGYAGQGHSAFEYWSQSGNELTICDLDTQIEVPEGTTAKLGPDYLNDLSGFDLLVRTPALHPRDIKAANPDDPQILDRVTTVTNEFMHVCPTKNIIGVTGTKGKGTTTSLVARLLEACGKRVHVGGNIGIPPLELLKSNIQPDDWVVLELANFQLIDIKASPPYAVCLMIEPEHLNWHADIDEYLEAKKQLFRWQHEDNLAIYYADNNYSKAIASVSAGLMIPYMAKPGAIVVEDERIMIDEQEICKINDIKLLGQHNWQNICAAVTVVWQICPDPEAMKRAISAFAGLPHRLELVREVDSVHYYNDSFASAPGASVAALNAVVGMKVMILGGFDRGLDLEDMARGFAMKQDEIRRLILIGASAKRLESALQAHGVNNYDLLPSPDLKEIVDHARAAAHQGDTVVFSPGFPSFDMFKNFEERGVKFKEIVNAL